MTVFSVRTPAVYLKLASSEVFWITVTLGPASSRLHRRLEEELIHVTPAPVLAGLETPYDRVVRRVEVLGGVASGRVVAAPDVAALLAQAKVDPVSAGGQALLAPLGRSGLNGVDIGEMGATLGHNGSFSAGRSEVQDGGRKPTRWRGPAPNRSTLGT
jgi:hypothetical protein